jgi:predicted dehydrogenase
VRNFAEAQDSEVVACCDQSQPALESLAKRYPGVRMHTDYRQMLEENACDAVVVVTPASTHRRIAEDCLAAGKHVLVEKPLAASSEDARALAQHPLADGQVFMVGHIFRFNAAVNKMRELIYDGTAGQVRYLTFLRTNLGPVRRDVSVIWDLAPHDVSIALHLLNSMPTEVSATKGTYLADSKGDVSFITLRFAGDVVANIHVSWVDPNKRREVHIVGSNAMLEFDDMNLAEPLRVSQRALRTEPSYSTFGEFQLVAHASNVTIPFIEMREPLKAQCEEFLKSIRTGRQPLSDVRDGYRICAILEAVERSADEGGASVQVSDASP